MDLNYPGQELEKALGKVVAEGGTSLSKALVVRVRAWVEKWAASDFARAAEIKADSAHRGELARASLTIEERRKQEVAELEHQQLLRSISRDLDEKLHRQKAVEYVAESSILINQKDPERFDGRDVSDDWLRRFFRYVSEVDEKQLLDVFAKALNEASIKTRPLISPKAIDTLRFFEKHTWEMFLFCVDEIEPFDSIPFEHLSRRARTFNQHVDVSLMIEMDLLKVERKGGYELTIGPFVVQFTFEPGERSDFNLLRLTHVGKSIAELKDERFRQLSNLLRRPRRQIGKLFQLQRGVGVDVPRLGDLGNSLVADLCVSGVFTIDVTAELNGRIQSIIDNRKKTQDDPFGLSEVNMIDFGADVSVLVGAFTEPFNYFDDNQLNALKGYRAGG